MTDNIKPEHYRKGEIDLFESWYLTYPFNEFRAIMSAIAERYMKRDKDNRIQDLDKAIYTLERLREKEIEHDRYSHVKTNYGESLEKGIVATEWTPAPEDVLGQTDFRTFGEELDNPKLFIRDIDASELLHNLKDDENIRLLNSLLDSDYNYLARDLDDCLWAYGIAPTKGYDIWASCQEDKNEKISKYVFLEVKWIDDKPTKIAELLATYENGGENGK